MRFFKLNQLHTINSEFVVQVQFSFSLLSQIERDWLNAYHQKVYDKLATLLHPYKDVKNWLQKSTRVI